MKLGIDGYYLCGKRTGMGTMLLNILACWKSDIFEKTVLFLPESSEGISEIESRIKNIEVCKIKRRSFPMWEQLEIPHYARKLSLDCLWFPYNTGSLFWNKRMVVTIHDMIYMHGSFLKQPTLYKKFGQMYRKWVVPIVAKKADCVLTSSKTSAHEIASYCPYAEKKTAVVYCSCETGGQELTSQQWESWCQKEGLNTEFILAVGSIDKRKNTLRTVKAFERLCDENLKYHLVLYGFKENISSEEQVYIRSSRWADRIHALGFIPDKLKNTLYRYAKVFSFASLNEGFGIPILEAFYRETVVVTSNVTSMPEIAGDAAVYVDPESIESICEGIKKALDNETQKDLISRGEVRLELFSWDNVANAAMQAIIR